MKKEPPRKKDKIIRRNTGIPMDDLIKFVEEQRQKEKTNRRAKRNKKRSS